MTDNLYNKYSQMWMVYEFMSHNKDVIRFIPTHGWVVNNGTIWDCDNNKLISKKIVQLIETTILDINNEIIEIGARLTGDEKTDKELKAQISALRYHINKMSESKYHMQVESSLMKLLTISNDNFNIDLTSINLKNGIFDLDQMVLRERKSTDYHRFVCNFEYNKDAMCPLWEKIIETILPDEEHRHYVQKLFGYTLSGHIREEKFTIFVGDGGNGKSTLITTIGNLMSGYAKVAPAETFIQKNSNNDVRRAGFEGRRFVYCEEIQKNYTLNTEFVKTFASVGSKISARHMREDPYEYTNNAKFVVSSNFPPSLGDTGRSIKRRLVIIPFTVDVYQTDLIKYKNTLDKLLENEYPGIFNWLIEGYKMWMKEGLSLPEGLQKFQADYISSNEILGDFIADILTIQDNTLTETSKNCVRKSDIYDTYRKWCVYRHEDTPLNKHMFYEELLQSLRSRNPNVQSVKKSNGYYFKGILMKEIPDCKPVQRSGTV